MGTLFSAFGLGLSGLRVAQVQLDVSGHNISNVNKEGYSRQRAELTEFEPLYLPYGTVGRGATIQTVTRARNLFLDGVYRNQVQEVGSSEIKQTYFNRMEDILNEPSDDSLGQRLNLFFDSLNDFANNVEDVSSRSSLLSEGEAVSGLLTEVAGRLDQLRTDANEELRNMVPKVNELASNIADLNKRIQILEATGNSANDLRDERDNDLDELSKMVKVTAREREDGMVDVVLGSDQFITGVEFSSLKAVTDSTLDPDRPDFLKVVFANSGRDAEIGGGEMYGIMEMRDTEIKTLSDRMDELARSLITSINRIHSQGNGLVRYTGTVESTNLVSDPTALLNSLPELPYDVTNGTFQMLVYDDATNAVAETVTVPVTTGATTVASIAAAINTSANLTASVTPEGVLQITPSSGHSFIFANDTSGALTALGINGFFTGTDAASIGVNQDMQNDPRLIASRYTTNPLETGVNDLALDMAALRNSNLMTNSQTFNSFYESMTVDLGVRSRLNNDTNNASQSFLSEVQTRRQETSGVNLDEEVTFLLLYQRAFQASSRVISIADAMLDNLMKSF